MVLDVPVMALAVGQLALKRAVTVTLLLIVRSRVSDENPVSTHFENV